MAIPGCLASAVVAAIRQCLAAAVVDVLAAAVAATQQLPVAAFELSVAV